LRYLRERVDAAALGEQALRDRLASHVVPFEELTRAGWDDIEDVGTLGSAIRQDYKRFLDARAQLLLKPIRDLCEGRAPTEQWISTAAVN
jgi:hypothetical protein